MQFDRVVVVGLGQLGLPVAKYVKEKGFEAYGYDANVEAIDRAERTAGIIQADDLSDFDVYIISISTHAPDDMFSPQIDGVLSIADRISKETKKDGALVSIESTVPKGTSKKVFEILNHRLHVVHAPHRWYSLEEEEHGVNQLRVIGGVCDCCLKAGLQFYSGTVEEETYRTTSTSSKSLGIPMHQVKEVEIAELTKIIENTHRYLQIAFAENLYLYCQSNNVKFSELREALNTK
jgi:UDP-N-acetyl-D-mannosaminuronic acid dehydrogenase